MADKALAIGLGILTGVALNFVPTLVAYARRHPDRVRLARLNVLSFVSFLLWAGLLGWAITGRAGGRVQRFMDDPHNQRRIRIGIGALVGLGLATTAYALTKR
jgi:hypothetical protein